LGIAGAASAYVAWLGPLAAKISIGSAVTGVGLPIALIGAGITALLYKMNQKRSPSDSPEQIAQQIFQNYIDEFVDNIIQSHFMNEVRSMQERMAQDLESFFLKRFESYIPTGQTLQSLLLRCEHYLENLPDRDITKYSIAIDIPARSPTHAADHFMTGGAPLSAPYKAQELQTNWILNNRYRIEVKLGEGGMGQVYRCIDLQLPNEPIALKLLRPELAHQDSFRERFLNEINVNRMLTHEGIVRSYDTVYDSSLGLFFFTMEYIDGVTLESLLKERLAGGYEPPFGYQEAAKYLYKLCEVLDYAHKRQVIHRDLKPSNIMVTTEGKVKLMDFGIAKLLGTQKASHTGKIGTFAYMAPEQDQGGEVSEAADIFSLGVLSYQMLTGKFPSGNAPSPSTLGVVLPAKVERMIMSAMEHNIKIRPTLDMIRNALGSN
jgi:hypothetical protein